MLTSKRREELRKIITARESVSVSDMAAYFSVTPETIRRDLSAFAAEGFVSKSYGGATLLRKVNDVSSHDTRVSFCAAEKRRIADSAASLIAPYDCVFIDHSTTTLNITEHLGTFPVTVVTNSQAVVNRLAEQKDVTLICTGGTFDRADQGFFGIETVRYLQSHYFDKAFLSCRSIDMSRGVCASKESVSEVWRSVIRSSQQVFLLADHTKIGRPAFTLVSEFSKISRIITDAPLSSEWMQFLNEIGLPVTIAD